MHVPYIQKNIFENIKLKINCSQWESMWRRYQYYAIGRQGQKPAVMIDWFV